MTTAKRRYDATSRRVRASQERAATRARVVRAAEELFTSRGYVATTVAQIAERAGVAVQSVYATGGSKAELLHLVSDLVVAGDDSQVLMADRAEIIGLADLTDPIDQLDGFAAVHVRIVDRALDVWAAERQAAAVDPRVAAGVAKQHQLRLTTYRGIARMLPKDALADGLDHDAAADVLWALASPDTGLLLRRERGWTRAQHQMWLRDTLRRALLRP